MSSLLSLQKTRRRLYDIREKSGHTLLWKGQKLSVTVTPKMIQITGEKQQEPVTLEIWGQEYSFQEELTVVKKAEN